MLTELQQIATLIATGVGVRIAWSGLDTWKRELTGKRDIALCQSVIEKFYEAEERMSSLRNPFTSASEGASRESATDEKVERQTQRNSAYVPLERWNNQIDFWTALLATKWQMRAAFGDGTGAPYAIIEGALRTFRASALTKYQMSLQNADSERVAGLDEAIWERSDDKIATEMKDAIAKMEAICVPIVRNSRPKLPWWSNIPFLKNRKVAA